MSNIKREFMVCMMQTLIITVGMLYHIYAHIGHLDKVSLVIIICILNKVQ